MTEKVLSCLDYFTCKDDDYHYHIRWHEIGLVKIRFFTAKVSRNVFETHDLGFDHTSVCCRMPWKCSKCSSHLPTLQFPSSNIVRSNQNVQSRERLYDEDPERKSRLPMGRLGSPYLPTEFFSGWSFLPRWRLVRPLRSAGAQFLGERFVARSTGAPFHVERSLWGWSAEPVWEAVFCLEGSQHLPWDPLTAFSTGKVTLPVANSAHTKKWNLLEQG